MYQPESRESLGGQKLIRKADFHLGQKVNTFFRIRCRISDPANDKKHFSDADKRHVTMYGEFNLNMIVYEKISYLIYYI